MQIIYFITTFAMKHPGSTTVPKLWWRKYFYDEGRIEFKTYIFIFLHSYFQVGWHYCGHWHWQVHFLRIAYDFYVNIYFHVVKVKPLKKKKIEKRSISSIAKSCFVSTKRCSMGSVNGYQPLNKIRQTNRCWKWMDQSWHLWNTIKRPKKQAAVCIFIWNSIFLTFRNKWKIKI